MVEAKPLGGWADSQKEHEHAPSDVRIRWFVAFVVGFISIAIILHLLLWWLFGVLVRAQPEVRVSPLARQMPLPPEPQLQGSIIHPALPADDLLAMRQRERSILETYGWVDRAKGIVRIPIDQAMRLTIQRGLPVTQPSENP